MSRYGPGPQGLWSCLGSTKPGLGAAAEQTEEAETEAEAEPEAESVAFSTARWYSRQISPSRATFPRLGDWELQSV
jgi:hypothetical protein